MKIRKDVYPPLESEYSPMFLAEKSLLEDMQTYILQPNEWQYILQCAWVIGFKEGRRVGSEEPWSVDLEDEEHGEQQVDSMASYLRGEGRTPLEMEDEEHEPQ